MLYCATHHHQGTPVKSSAMLLSSILLAIAAPAFAGGKVCPPKKPPVITPSVPTNTNTNTSTAGAASNAASNATASNLQGQQQGQQQGQALSSTNDLSSTLANTSSNVNSIGGQSVVVQSGNDNGGIGDARMVFIPAIIPPTPPSTVGIGDVVQTTMACGPVQQVVRTPIDGTFFGLASHRKVQQGFTYDLAPVFDANGQRVEYRREMIDGEVHLFGSQPVILSTVVAISGARNLALGGGGSSGSWGQGGTGTSSSMSQLVTNIQVRDCELGTLRPAPPAPVVRVETIKAAPIVHHRKRAIRRHKAGCVSVTKLVCQP